MIYSGPARCFVDADVAAEEFRPVIALHIGVGHINGRPFHRNAADNRAMLSAGENHGRFLGQTIQKVAQDSVAVASDLTGFF